jgi:hypothetical protein
MSAAGHGHGSTMATLFKMNVKSIDNNRVSTLAALYPHLISQLPQEHNRKFP